jgi:sugar/nucleoside kinase (ribokinase family)
MKAKTRCGLSLVLESRMVCTAAKHPSGASMKRTQVVGIGNALVDVIAHTDDAFLKENGVEKGIMQLIDRPRAVELYGHMGPAREVSGGSAANTIAGLAALGARTAYVGKVRDDQLGAIFAHDLRAQGAGYATPLAPADHAHETGRCMVLVTADGERSMNTYLGVSEFLSPHDIDETVMAETEWIFLEGYRYDGPDSIAAFDKAVRATRRAGGKVGITLSDPFCVERHRDEFLRMIRDDVDLLLANEHELKSLYLTDDLDAAMAQAAAEVPITVCTASARGAHVLTGGEHFHAPVKPVEVVDVTGAGDLFAAGFFHGMLAGRDWTTCARMGNTAAGEVISHVGARPEADLRALFAAEGLT